MEDEHDHEKPRYHILPRRGWMNDPNGPVYYNGQYHMFYQHIEDGCEWDFGIIWGHAVSSDLIRWDHLPPALSPTEDGYDADGCFSGCCVIDSDGTPTILYTGVRLRSRPPPVPPHPPPECDLNLPFIEAQLVARANIGDKRLASWEKSSQPFVLLPPANMPLVGWRDPFIFEFKGEGFQEWGMLLGSGIRGKGGAVLKYRSPSLCSGWRYEGMLCSYETAETGAMWECPLIAKLDVVPGASPADSQGRAEGLPRAKDAAASGTTEPAGPSLVEPAARHSSAGEANDVESRNGVASSSERCHFMCISPDAPTNPVLYWLGDYDREGSTFLLEGAVGPFRLDLGDVLYAPNLLQDKQGRHILWGWLQERRKVGSYNYAGCLSVPRHMYVRGGRLVQEPLPEVAELRLGKGSHMHGVQVAEGKPVAVEGTSGVALDLECTISRGSASAAGLLIRNWNAGGEGSAAVVYDWTTRNLEAIFEGQQGGAAQDVDNPLAASRRVGGPVSMEPCEPLQLRMLLDGSCLEVYIGSGEVLSTRVYRGQLPPNAEASIELIAYGGEAVVEKCSVYDVSSMWVAHSEANEAGPARHSSDGFATRVVNW